MSEFDDSLLKIANTPMLSQFLHDCVSDLIGLKPLSFHNYNSDIEWTVEDFNKTKHSIQKFYRQCITSHTFDISNVNLGNDVQQALQNCFEIRKDQLFEALIKEKLLQNNHTVVQNIDWRLKWVLGSSKLASIKESLLQMDLHCITQENNNESADKPLIKTINFEMNLEMVDNLIAQLEKGQNELENVE